MQLSSSTETTHDICMQSLLDVMRSMHDAPPDIQILFLVNPDS
jgi:hypothetical protein